MTQSVLNYMYPVFKCSTKHTGNGLLIHLFALSNDLNCNSTGLLNQTTVVLCNYSYIFDINGIVIFGRHSTPEEQLAVVQERHR